ncbi:MAG: crossover junction endodeoxyribonuclease RuvC [Rhodospirillales bacterium]|jgi:crossover junction endodeoxyribonuclease RuvC
MKLLGLDPGLKRTGWGIIEANGNHLTFVASGSIEVDAKAQLAKRLSMIFDDLVALIERYKPDEAAVEETFVNKNPHTTLKLGQARGIALLAPAQAGLEVAEYSPNLVKKTVVGVGHAAKQQIQMMVQTILPASTVESEDEADALAVAICHAHHRTTAERLSLLGAAE